MPKFKVFLKNTANSLKKHSPAILLTCGVATGIAAVGTAIYSTVKVYEDFDIQEKKKVINNLKELHEVANSSEDKSVVLSNDKALTITEIEDKLSQEKKDLAKKTVKHYITPAVLLTSSIALNAASYGMIRKRYCAAVISSNLIYEQWNNDKELFSKYRSKVAEELGKEKENDLYYCVENLKKTVIDSETGEVVQEEQPKQKVFTRFFDESSKYYDDSATYNEHLIRQTLKYCNHLINEGGLKCLFLNDVLKQLGFIIDPNTPEYKLGQLYGWKREPGNKEYILIDAGLDDEVNRAFLNGETSVARLCFNVQGNIL